MGLPSMSSRRSAIWLGVARGGQALAGAGDGLEQRVLRPRTKCGKCNALAGAVQAGIDARCLALGERAHGERLCGDAGGVGGDAKLTLHGDSAPVAVCHETIARSAARRCSQDQRLHGPRESGAGRERKLRRKRGKHRRRSAHKLRLEARAVGERSSDDGPRRARSQSRSWWRGHRPWPRREQTGKPQAERGRSAGNGIDDRDAAGGREVRAQRRDGEGKRHADGNGIRGRGDQRVSASPLPES